MGGRPRRYRGANPDQIEPWNKLQNYSLPEHVRIGLIHNVDVPWHAASWPIINEWSRQNKVRVIPLTRYCARIKALV